MPLVVAPIHSPRSFALAREVLSPTIRVRLPSCWCAIVRMRDTMTCTIQSRKWGFGASADIMAQR